MKIFDISRLKKFNMRSMAKVFLWALFIFIVISAVVELSRTATAGKKRPASTAEYKELK